LHFVTAIVLQAARRSTYQVKSKGHLRLIQLILESALAFHGPSRARKLSRRFKMNAYKGLVTAIAAASVVGAVGFVSAQTTSSDPAVAPQSTGAPMNNAAPNNAPITSPTPLETRMPAPEPAVIPSPTPLSASPAPVTPVDTSVSAVEPMPKADRN
jgi:hypothetical protein